MPFYKVKLKNGDKEIEVEGDRKYIDQMLGKYPIFASMSEVPAIAIKKDKKGEQTQSQSTVKQLSPAEFLFQIGLKRHADIVLSFVYYLEQFREKAAASPADINNCYYEAKIEPSNTSQMISRNIRLGKMMEDKINKGKGKKLYTITQVGIKYLEKHLKPSA